ncbi:hypothetical protein Hanom_Chr13g01233311 [Helianthus anomalus]
MVVQRIKCSKHRFRSWIQTASTVFWLWCPDLGFLKNYNFSRKRSLFRVNRGGGLTQ